jgi:hypothetical protein
MSPSVYTKLIGERSLYRAKAIWWQLFDIERTAPCYESKTVVKWMSFAQVQFVLLSHLLNAVVQICKYVNSISFFFDVVFNSKPITKFEYVLRRRDGRSAYVRYVSTDDVIEFILYPTTTDDTEFCRLFNDSSFEVSLVWIIDCIRRVNMNYV